MTSIQQKLRDTIATLARIDPSAIALDTPLVKDRILTSVMILDLILSIEELRGAPVDGASIKPSAFRDVASIATAFFGESSHG
jgi:acyl carrier protein